MYVALIVIALIAILVICLVWIVTSTRNSSSDETLSIPNYFISDCHLQRLLMIETLRPSSSSGLAPSAPLVPSVIPPFIADGTSRIASEFITADHIKKEGMTFIKALSRYFNNSTVQTMATLMNKRQSVLQEYYRTMYSMVCDKGACVLPGTKDQLVFPDLLSHDSLNVTSDVTTLVQRRLSEIAREITDTLAAAINIHHKSTIPMSTGTNLKEEFCNQRLYNLLVIYDKGLINQAKSYASHDYDISMNSSQSSLSIAQHISAELLTIIKVQQ